jgi:ribosomal protein L40E
MPQLRDYVSDYPLYFVCGFIVWLPVAVWVMGLVHWMIQGDLDVLSGFLGSVVAIVLGVFTMRPPVPALAPLFLLAVLAILGFFPYVRSMLEHRAHVQIDVEALERAYSALDLKPGNFGATWRLAQVLYQRGVVGHALAIAEDLLDGADPEIFHEELRILHRWQEDVRTDQIRALPCMECGKMNAPGTLYCSRCRSKYLLDYAKGRWFGTRSVRRLLAVWIAAVAGLVGVPTAATALEPSKSMVVVPLLAVLAVALIWRAFATANGADAA